MIGTLIHDLPDSTATQFPLPTNVLGLRKDKITSPGAQIENGAKQAFPLGLLHPVCDVSSCHQGPLA